MEKLKKEFGKHYIVELIECEPEKLKLVEDVEKIFMQAAEESQATILKHYFHQFEPSGVTGIILIAESHFSVHTWPDDRYVAFDVLTCGEMYPEKAIDVLKAGFAAKKTEVKIIPRGY